METTALKPDIEPSDRFFRWLAFMVLATIGMGSIGVAVLAEPLARHYSDRAVLLGQQRRIEKLGEFQGQLGELLANAENPSVIERAAIGTMRCVPMDAAQGQAGALPVVWPELEEALKKIDAQPVEAEGPGQRFMEVLGASRFSQSILMMLGSGLVLVALTFFYRPR